MTPTPAPTPTVTLTLTENAARLVLEAMHALQTKWLHVNHTTGDEDEQAEYGMDVADLHATRLSIEQQAVRAFGQAVKQFLHEPPLVPPAPAPNGHPVRHTR